MQRGRNRPRRSAGVAGQDPRAVRSPSRARPARRSRAARPFRATDQVKTDNPIPAASHAALRPVSLVIAGLARRPHGGVVQATPPGGPAGAGGRPSARGTAGEAATGRSLAAERGDDSARRHVLGGIGDRRAAACWLTEEISI